ncbi:MAG: hypothetical protein AAF417_19440 [Pseudomonadota bacterium]
MDNALGLGSLGFWLFVAAAVLGGIWSDIRKRESQQETLRRIVESGRDVDPALVAKILSSGQSETLERDLRIGGFVVIAAAAGLALLGWFLSATSEDALMPLLGVAALVGCVGIGLLAAAGLVERKYPATKGG